MCLIVNSKRFHDRIAHCLVVTHKWAAASLKSHMLVNRFQAVSSLKGCCLIWNFSFSLNAMLKPIRKFLQGDKSVARWRRKAWCLDTRGFILKKIQWHIHAGSWSLVNCWREALTRHYIRCSWILMNAAVSLMDGLGLDSDRCIRMIPWHPPFSVKEEALPACKELLQEILQWSLRDRVMQQIWMYYKEKLTKNLADLNTFETSMSLRDRITT